MYMHTHRTDYNQVQYVVQRYSMVCSIKKHSTVQGDSLTSRPKDIYYMYLGQSDSLVSVVRWEEPAEETGGGKKYKVQDGHTHRRQLGGINDGSDDCDNNIYKQ